MQALTCPDCNSHIEVSWGRYFQSSFKGIYECPFCRIKSKIRIKPKIFQFCSWGIQLVVVSVIPVAFLTSAWFSGGALLAFSGVLLLDKFIDSKYGVLVEAT